MISGTIAVVLFWIVAGLIVWVAWSTIWKVKDHYRLGGEMATRSLLSVFKWRLVAFIVLGLSLYYLPTTWNSQVRPRNTIDVRVQSSTRHAEEVPFVSVSNAPTWNQKMATNRAQNEAAQKEFDKLPNKQ